MVQEPFFYKPVLSLNKWMHLLWHRAAFIYLQHTRSWTPSTYLLFLWFHCHYRTDFTPYASLRLFTSDISYVPVKLIPSRTFSKLHYSYRWFQLYFLKIFFSVTTLPEWLKQDFHQCPAISFHSPAVKHDLWNEMNDLWKWHEFLSMKMITSIIIDFSIEMKTLSILLWAQTRNQAVKTVSLNAMGTWGKHTLHLC